MNDILYELSQRSEMTIEEILRSRYHLRMTIQKKAMRGEFYNIMLERDRVLGMSHSLPDELVNEIFGYI